VTAGLALYVITLSSRASLIITSSNCLAFTVLLATFVSVFCWDVVHSTALLLRGLDALTTEPSIINSLAAVCDIKSKNVFVVRNPLTGLSRGYAVVECSSIRDSAMLLDAVNNSGSSFEVDGKAIIVSFAKNTYNTLLVAVIAFVW